MGQVIKISSLAFDIKAGDLSLRDVLREAIYTHVPDSGYAFWFNTIRNIVYIEDIGEVFSNDLYITIIKEGQDSKIDGLKGFLRGFWPPLERNYRMMHLVSAFSDLHELTAKIMESLSSFSPRMLGFIESDEVVYSEIYRFFAYLYNLEWRDRQVSLEDASEYLFTANISSAFNTLEIIGTGKGRKYAAVLSIKEYSDIPPEALDHFLQMPRNMIISESVNFIQATKPIKEYKEFKGISDLVDEEYSKVSGIDLIINSNKGLEIDFAEHQLSIVLHENSPEELERSVADAVSRLGSLGYVCIREDLRLEEDFYAQIPANFSFVKRKKAISTFMVAGFTSLKSYPTGLAIGSKWQGATKVFTNQANGAPYYFNFHDVDGNGHTMIFGPEYSDNIAFLNNIISEIPFEVKKFSSADFHDTSDFISALEEFSSNFSYESGIVIFDDAWKLMDNQEFITLVPDLLDGLASRGIVGIFIGSDPESLIDSTLSKIFARSLGTQIFLPNIFAGLEYIDLGLTDTEQAVVSMMENAILLKQNGNAIACAFIFEKNEVLP